MKPDHDDLPVIQDSARGLGVRVPEDIGLDHAGDVHPASGGMSVASDRILDLPAHRRPRAMGHGSTGHAGDYVFCLDPDALDQRPLKLRRDSRTHALIEPDKVMGLATYRRTLAETRDDRSVAWPE